MVRDLHEAIQLRDRRPSLPRMVWDRYRLPDTWYRGDVGICGGKETATTLQILMPHKALQISILACYKNSKVNLDHLDHKVCLECFWSCFAIYSDDKHPKRSHEAET